ncbi:MAG: four helix bundle protein [Terrimicrobiaceae bacterium]|nr:four helix bundle protein [Terrimicrobiaceae bacterium]
MNDGSNAVLDKSYAFALAGISLSRSLQNLREFVLSRQFVCSATSIGANLEEAQASQTRPEFHTLMSRAEKEARESHYWLRLIRDSYPEVSQAANDLLDGAQELKRILAAITKSTKG